MDENKTRGYEPASKLSAVESKLGFPGNAKEREISTMRIMWLCNMAPGAVRAVTGGISKGALWMDHIFSDLRNYDMQIRILYADGSGKVNGQLDALCSYASFYENEPHKYRCELENRFVQELNQFDPDLVHIWGTEYGHTLAMANAAEKTGYLEKIVVSIQGMCSVIARHYAEGLPVRVRYGNTFRDFIKRNNIVDQHRRFVLRGKMEVEALRKVKHVIGRTDWDEACTTQINPEVHYHFCNETLRQEFYEGNWQYDACKKHRIFASSCEYPVKGFHYLLEALAQVVKSYPDAEVVVAGADPFPRKIRFEKLRKSVYAKYMLDLIKKHGLQDKVKVLGFLSAEQMRREMLESNVFVLPSTIENSPNSMGEAMMLGVPCVASDVGGVANLIDHKKEGYVYQSTAPYMLAHYIMKVFAMEDAAEAMGKAAQRRAAVTHAPEINCKQLLDIYETIARESTY